MHNKHVRKNQKGFGAIALLIALVVIIVAGSVAWRISMQSSRAPATSNVQIPKCTPVSLEGGHTYSNAQVGYCISLPNKWHYVKGQVIKDDTGQVVKDSNGRATIAPDSIEPINSPQNTLGGIAEVYTDTSTMSPKTYFENNGAGRAMYSSGDGTATNINGYQAYIANLSGQSSARVVTVSHNNKIVEFFYYSNSSMNPYASLCEQIISTIKFN